MTMIQQTITYNLFYRKHLSKNLSITGLFPQSLPKVSHRSNTGDRTTIPCSRVLCLLALSHTRGYSLQLFFVICVLTTRHHQAFKDISAERTTKRKPRWGSQCYPSRQPISEEIMRQSTWIFLPCMM